MRFAVVLEPIATLSPLGTAAAVAAAVLLLCGRPWRNPRPPRVAAGWVLGVGTGFYLGCGLLEVRFHWPPREDQDRLLLLLLPAVIGVELAAAVGLPKRWLGLLRLLVAASAVRVLLHRSTYLVDLAGPGSREWSPAQSWLVLGGLGAALALVWAALLSFSRKRPGPSLPLALALTCAGAAITVMCSGYATGGLLGLPLAAVLGGATAASLLLSGPPEGRGAVGMGIVGLFSLLLMGRCFGQLSTTHAVVLFAAPLLCWLPELPYLRWMGPRLRGLVAVGLVVVPVALVVARAWHNFDADSRAVAGAVHWIPADRACCGSIL